ncbi:hypothetical protein ACNFJ7_08300 [Sphingomonas sp. HT-1]|uniref:hypothetical protein n=1 Tax=unclassified Sphingomonas TaxID=196159 RepID=UPI000366DCEA|nr:MULTISPECIES: hypothetical protein [unclassified Sphingomonas]
MQRTLTIRDAQRHAFRSHVRATMSRHRKAKDDGDVRLFLLSFAAFFTCFYTFLL